MNRRILLTRFSSSSPFGSQEKHILELIKGLSPENVSFYFFGQNDFLINRKRSDDPTAQTPHIPSKKIWLPKIPESFFAFSLSLFFLIPYVLFIFFPLLAWYRVIKRCKLIFCLSFREKILFYPLAAFLGYKIFWSEFHAKTLELSSAPIRWFFVFFSRKVTIVASSDAIRARLRKLGVKEKNIAIIPPALDVDVFIRQSYVHCPDEQSPTYSDIVSGKHDETLKRNAVKDFVVGTVCSLKPHRGLEILLKAAVLSYDFIRRLRIVVVGDGMFKKNLLWLQKEYGLHNALLLPGFHENTGDWIRRFDVFVLCAKEGEELSSTLFEASALAKPIIAPKNGSVNEIVIHGKTGILIEPMNAETLSSAMINFYRHPDWRHEYGMNAQKRMRDHFGTKTMIASYKKLFLG